MHDLYSDKSVLSHLLDSQTPGGQRSEQLGFRFGEVEPRKPVRLLQDDHLPIVDRRYIGTGLGREECERVAATVGHRAPQSRKAEPVLAGLGELPLRFRGLRAGELEEVRRRDKAAPFREPAPLGTEIDHRCALGPRRREAPTQLNQLHPMLPPPKNGCRLCRPDVIAGFKIGAAVGKTTGARIWLNAAR